MEKLPTFKEIQGLLDEARNVMPPEIQIKMLRQESALLSEIANMDPTMKTITYLKERSDQMRIIQSEVDLNSLNENQRQKLEEIGEELTKIGQRLQAATNNSTLR